MFWAKAKEFLEEDVGTAVDDWRHSKVVHLAKAISVRDLREQVSIFSTMVARRVYLHVYGMIIITFCVYVLFSSSKMFNVGF